MASPSLEIRSSRKTVLMGTAAGWLMRVWCATLRYEIMDRCGLSAQGAASGPIVFALWHNRLFCVPDAWRRLCGSRRHVSVLTSASKDGDVLARAVGVFGIGAVRGSTSRRAVAALVGLRKLLKAGEDVCITPDGPRGPRYQLQAGLVKLAESSGAVVVPIHVKLDSYWQLKSWDHFRIPKPFSRVRVIFDRALAVPPSLADDAFEAERARIEAILLSGTDDHPSYQSP